MIKNQARSAGRLVASMIVVVALAGGCAQQTVVAGPGPQKPPVPGKISQTVKSKPVRSSKPVGLEKRTSDLGSGVTAEISEIGSQRVKAKLPGEISGPSIVFEVMITNGSSTTLDLNAVVVNVTDAQGIPANRITSDPAEPMPDTLAPGKSARGTWVFVVPKKDRDPVTIELAVSAELKVAVFRGDLG